ncbi:hypothetical protein [Microbacterium sp. GXF0217]
MKKRLSVVALVAATMTLAGCSASFDSVAEECGGSDAGITVTSDGVLEYDQDHDSTGEASTCLLQGLVPDKTEQYTITQALTPGVSGDVEGGGHTIVYGMSPDGAVRLFFNP